MAYTVAESYAQSIEKNNLVASTARTAGYDDWADIVDGATRSMCDAIANATLNDDLRSIARSGSAFIDQIVSKKFDKARARVVAAMGADNGSA